MITDDYKDPSMPREWPDINNLWAPSVLDLPNTRVSHTSSQSEFPVQPDWPPGADALERKDVLGLADDLAVAVRSLFEVATPVHVPEWAFQTGVEVIDVNGVVDGKYVRDRDQSRILLRHGLEERRRNFTFVHELGHHFLEEARRDTALRRSLPFRARKSISQLPVGSLEEERVCNAFAGSLLIPTVQISGAALTLPKLISFANHAKVSPLTAAIRILEVTHHSVAFLRCKMIDDEWVVERYVGQLLGDNAPSVVALPPGLPWFGYTSAVLHAAGSAQSGKARRALLEVQRIRADTLLVLIHSVAI